MSKMGRQRRHEHSHDVLIRLQTYRPHTRVDPKHPLGIPLGIVEAPAAK
jgi:hypothetical protein